MTPPPASHSSLSAALDSASGGGGGEAEQLIERLTRQRDLYRSLEALSSKQQTVIAEGQTEQLLAVLSERQVIVDQLTTLNAEIAPQRGRMTEIAEAAPADQRQTLRGLVDEVQGMLRSIIEQDEQDRQSLETNKQRVGQELAKLKTAPAAINAYRANAYAKSPGPAAASPSARFTDARG